MKLHPYLRSAAALLASGTLLLGLTATLPAVAEGRMSTSESRRARLESVTPEIAVGGEVPVNAEATPWVVQLEGNRRRPATVPTPSYAVEKDLTANAIGVHRAALKTWPQIVTYYGYRNDPSSDHYTGKALDVMIPKYTTRAGKSLGGKIAEWAVVNQPDLHIQYVIWNQQIWNVSRAGEGWRPMADRGSDSANHKNHVHISVQ